MLYGLEHYIFQEGLRRVVLHWKRRKDKVVCVVSEDCKGKFLKIVILFARADWDVDFSSHSQIFINNHTEKPWPLDENSELSSTYGCMLLEAYLYLLSNNKEMMLPAEDPWKKKKPNLSQTLKRGKYDNVSGTNNMFRCNFLEIILYQVTSKTN